MNHLETSRMDRYFCPHHPPPKYNRNNIFLYLWPLTLFLIFTPFFTVDKGAHVSLASKSCWVRRWVFRWKPFLVSVFSQPPAVVPALLNSVVLWSSSPQHAYPSQVQLAYVTCWLSRQTARTPAYTWLSCPSFREELDVKSIEVCTEKDKNLYFSLPTSRKIFLQFAWGIFFFFKENMYSWW